MPSRSNRCIDSQACSSTKRPFIVKSLAIRGRSPTRGPRSTSGGCWPWSRWAGGHGGTTTHRFRTTTCDSLRRQENDQLLDRVTEGWVLSRGASREQQAVGLRFLLAVQSCGQFDFPLSEEAFMEEIQRWGLIAYRSIGSACGRPSVAMKLNFEFRIFRSV